MTSIFIIAAVISLTFLVIKFLEMRYIDNEPKPLKLLVRDTLLVYVSVVCGNFIIEQLQPVLNEVDIQDNPMVFTDNPSF